MVFNKFNLDVSRLFLALINSILDFATSSSDLTRSLCVILPRSSKALDFINFKFCSSNFFSKDIRFCCTVSTVK